MKSLLGVVLLNLCVTLSSFAQLEQIHKETIFSYYSNLAFSQDSQYILKVTPDISRKNSVITVLNNKLEVISEVVLFGNDPEVKLTPDGQNYVVLTQNNAVFIFDIFGGLVDTYCEVGGCKKVGNWRDIKINSSSDHALFFSQENGLSLRSLTGELKFHHTYKNNYIPFGFVPNKSMFWYQEYDKRVVFLNLNAEVLFEINWEQLGHNGSRGILVDTSNEEKLIILDSSTNKIWIFDYTGQLISNFTVENGILPHGGYYQLKVASDGSCIAFSNGEYNPHSRGVYVYDLTTGKMVSKYPFKDNREYIKSLRFHQDQKTLSFVFHHAGEIQKTKALFWNLLSNNITSIFENEGDFANLRYMIFSPDEQYLIGYSSNYFYNSDSSLKIWKFK